MPLLSALNLKVKMLLIKLENLQKLHFNSKDNVVTALEDVSLNIEKGEFVAIMGPSGSGKSTLMHIMGFLDRASSGKYFFEGQDVTSLSDDELAEIRNQKVGFVFQAFNLLPRTSAIDNVILPMLYTHRFTGEEMTARAKELLNLVGLADRYDHHPSELSGGQQQRVAIARALVNKPAVIFADEPTGNLDSKSTVEIMKIFHDLHEQGNTVIFVTHEEDVAKEANRIIKLKDGSVLSDTRN